MFHVTVFKKQDFDKIFWGLCESTLERASALAFLVPERYVIVNQKRGKNKAHRACRMLLLWRHRWLPPASVSIPPRPILWPGVRDCWINRSFVQLRTVYVKNAARNILGFSPNLCDNTAPTPIWEASTSKINGHSGSGWCRMEAEMQAVFNHVKALSATPFHWSHICCIFVWAKVSDKTTIKVSKPQEPLQVFDALGFLPFSFSFDFVVIHDHLSRADDITYKSNLLNVEFTFFCFHVCLPHMRFIRRGVNQNDVTICNNIVPKTLCFLDTEKRTGPRTVHRAWPKTHNVLQSYWKLFSIHLPPWYGPDCMCLADRVYWRTALCGAIWAAKAGMDISRWSHWDRNNLYMDRVPLPSF